MLLVSGGVRECSVRCYLLVGECSVRCYLLVGECKM